MHSSSRYPSRYIYQIAFSYFLGQTSIIISIIHSSFSNTKFIIVLLFALFADRWNAISYFTQEKSGQELYGKEKLTKIDEN